MKEAAVDTHSKALRINLDPRWYGTFAEIGAGQEVVRWFFRVGVAAGTRSTFETAAQVLAASLMVQNRFRADLLNGYL